MGNLTDQIRNKFKSANIVEQFVYINIAVFVLTYLVNSISFLMKFEGNFVFDWFSLPANFENIMSRPWTILTYGFLHEGIWHILFNLIILYYIGNLFLDFFSKRDFLFYYFLGMFFGGLIFILSYNFFPALKSERAFLVGASAAVTSILIGIATKIPNYALHFKFIGAIKLWYIAVAIVLLDIVQIPISNAGGHLAHLGGALTGFLLTSLVTKNNSLSLFFSNLFKAKKQKPLKTVYKKRKPSKTVKNSNSHQRKIDDILDKISKSGYETLSKEEKEFLFSMGNKKDQ